MKRHRGGASHECPHCGANTRVRTTWRTPESVTRERECKGRKKHRYYTLETFAGPSEELTVNPDKGLVTKREVA
jgi:hypothetical protein